MEANPKQRRRHSAAFKAQVLAACAEPGASVAAVALSFKLNDNLVHQWRRGRGGDSGCGTSSTAIVESTPQFIALSLPVPPSPPAAPPTAKTMMITSASRVASDCPLICVASSITTSPRTPLALARAEASQ